MPIAIISNKFRAPSPKAKAGDINSNVVPIINIFRDILGDTDDNTIFSIKLL
ncbi:hypothetical protein Cfast33896_04660 [Coprobacter fastidiosus]|nr:hypothetical protein Cfast33896_04660 [Coprobacter fastidiosus]